MGFLLKKSIKLNHFYFCIECDTIIHKLWECEKVVPIINGFLEFIKSECNINFKINMIDYIFGINAITNVTDGLNHCFLELKIFSFYHKYSTNESSQQILTVFLRQLKGLIVREKMLAIKNKCYDRFNVKWDKFVGIYDYRGPNIDMF